MAVQVAPAWDFQDHTINHANLTVLSSSQIVDQLKSVNIAFQEHGLPSPIHIAYPNGAYNAQVATVVSQYRLSGRLATSDGRSSETYPIANWLTLNAVPLVASTTVDRAKSLIDDAVQKKGLMNLFTHSVLDPPDGTGCSPATLSQILDYLVAQQTAGKLSVLTMSQAYNQYNGQKAVVVLSFDDGWYTDYSVVWPMFKARGLAGTSYIIINNVNSNSAARLNWAQVLEMAQTSQTVPSSWSIKINLTPSVGGTTYPSGTISNIYGPLTVSATPNTGNTFSYWLFDGNILTSNPVTIPVQTAGTNYTLIAHFVPTQTSTPSPTPVITPTPSPTQIPTPTPTPTPIPTPAETPSPTDSPTQAPTSTPTPLPPVDPTPFPTTSTSPVSIPSPSPTLTPTHVFTSVPSPSPSLKPQNTPSASPTDRLDLTYTPLPSQTPSNEPPSAPFSSPSPLSTSASLHNQNSSNLLATPLMPEATNLSTSLPIEVIMLAATVVIAVLITAVFLTGNKRSPRH